MTLDDPLPIPPATDIDVPPATPVSRTETAAMAMIGALVEAGVDTFFGIPGGPVSPVFDAILRTPGARLIESRHETGAAFAAADYTRATGRTAAVVVTAGPGVTNVVTGVVSASLEAVPMLVIAGDVAWSAAGGRLLQDCGPEGISAEAILGHNVRTALRIAGPKAAVPMALSALQAAQSLERPGPALLILPIQFGTSQVSLPQVVAARPRQSGTDAGPEAALRQTLGWLAAARHPLLVLGAGCRPHAKEIADLVDALGIPVLTTPQAKGLVSEDHPLSLRQGGLAASLAARRYTAQGVDAALVLGTDLDDCSIGPTPYIAANGHLIHVDRNPGVFGRNLPTALGITADLGAVATTLTRMIAQGPWQAPATHRPSGAAVEASPTTAPGSPIHPAQALHDLQAAAAPDAHFITDIGEHMLFALHYLTARGPDDFTIHLGLGSMGSGIAGSIGRALGQPDRQVVCICGDGGMQMVGSEILVALKHRLRIVFAVFNDARYNMVFHGFRQVFGREEPWDTEMIDFAGWAGAMGVPAARITAPGEITHTLLQDLGARGPCVLDIRIDRDARLTGAGRNEALLHMSMQGKDK